MGEGEGGGRRSARGALSLPVALFPPVSPVSLESGIGACSKSDHESCGLGGRLQANGLVLSVGAHEAGTRVE